LNENRPKPVSVRRTRGNTDDKRLGDCAGSSSFLDCGFAIICKNLSWCEALHYRNLCIDRCASSAGSLSDEAGIQVVYRIIRNDDSTFDYCLRNDLSQESTRLTSVVSRSSDSTRT